MNLSKHILKLACILLVVFGSVNSDATTYFVSNSGNDDNDGLSPENAWKTIQKVNGQTFLPGDSVLFHAGSIWREKLVINESGMPGNFIVFSRYGEGKNPMIFGSDKAENWTPTGVSNVWQSGTDLNNYSEEYFPGRMFFTQKDKISWGQFKTYDNNFSKLMQEFDYTVNGTRYYVYSTTNPESRYDAVEVSQRSGCIINPDNEPQSYLVIDGIDFRFSRIWGYNAGYPAYRGATDLIFRNCTIGYIGARPSGAAYGISVWHSNLLVENCVITDCGRRGVSVNLYLQMPVGMHRTIENVIIRHNVFKRGYHTTALDLSCQMTSTDTMQNIYFYNNYVDDSEFSEICDNCGSNQVFFQCGDSVSYVNNIYVAGNVFIHSTARNILFEGEDTSYVWHNSIIGHNPNITEHPYQNVGWNSNSAKAHYQNNILYDNLPDNALHNHGVFIYETYDGVFVEKDNNLYYSLFPKTDRNFSAHRLNNTGVMGYWNTNVWDAYLISNPRFEQNSPHPAKPGFVDYYNGDFRLTKNSPALGAGAQLPVVIVIDPEGVKDTLCKYDFNGIPYNTQSPSLGAYEYATLVNIRELSQKQDATFRIAPNPAKDYCKIYFNESGSFNGLVKVYNLQGELAYKNNIRQITKTITIPIGNIKPGVYFVVIKPRNGYSQCKKFIITK